MGEDGLRDEAFADLQQPAAGLRRDLRRFIGMGGGILGQRCAAMTSALTKMT